VRILCKADALCLLLECQPRSEFYSATGAALGEKSQSLARPKYILDIWEGQKYVWRKA